MTDDEIKRIQKRANYVAAKRGYSELADDFSQAIIVKFLEGRGRSQTIDQAFIDYLREQYGRTGTPGGDATSLALHTMANLDEARDIASGAEEQHYDLGFDHLFTGIRLTVYTKRFIDEMGLKEIGDILGVTESRVCQIVARIEGEIRENMILRESIHQMETDPNFTKLEVDWIRL